MRSPAFWVASPIKGGDTANCQAQKGVGECSKCHSHNRQKFRRDGHTPAQPLVDNNKSSIIICC